MSNGEPIIVERTIRAATGYCELGMWQAAWDELEKLAPEERALPVVLRVRLGIFIALERWEAAVALAEGMIARGEDSPVTWLHGALAIRRHRSLEEARAFLVRADETLRENATFHYTLATLDCQLGNMTSAKERLSRALELNPELRLMALEDEDLWPIW
jgi:tetratricopeptide (TPR) repeat protein